MNHCCFWELRILAEKDSTDEDVIESGSLVGLSCAGKFELETPFFKSAETYNVDVPLTYDGTTGDVKPTTYGSGDPIVGIVSRNRGTKSVKGTNSNVSSFDVVSFNTNFVPNPVPGT